MGLSEYLHRYRWPKKEQLRQFFQILTKKEKIVFFSCLGLFTASASFLSIGFYLANTEIKPAEGGSYTEGIMGSPRLINPIYAPANDADRDLAEIIFSGLMKYDSQGKLTEDLAETHQVFNEGKVYEFYLKKNILWHDGQPLNADDVIFTIKTIQNPDYKSPLRANWLGVEVEKISDSAVRFKLKNPSAIFLENAAVKILPKHIWEEISSANFPLTIYNLKPVGSGPFKFKSLEQSPVEGRIVSLELVRNNAYFGKEANLSRLSFKFFTSEDSLIKSWEKKEIDGFSPASSIDRTIQDGSANLYSLTMPRYFAVFFNAGIFSQKEIRQALNYGTDKQDLVGNLLGGKGEIVDSPILPSAYGYEQPLSTYQFNLETANILLAKAGFQMGIDLVREKIVKNNLPFQFKSNLRIGSQGSEVKELQKCLARDPELYPEGLVSGYFGSTTKAAVVKFQEKYRQDILKPAGLDQGTGEVLRLTINKLNEICLAPPTEKKALRFTLMTSDYPQLVSTANALKEQWKKLGADVAIKSLDAGTLEREVIKPRDYDALLFGEILGAVQDPFPFWHSSQKKDPGLNLTAYDSKESDKLLEEARQTLDESGRKQKLEQFQNTLISDAPAVFLYSPDYLYLVSKKIKGINLKMILDPSKRFSEIENWHIYTKRTWK